MGCASRHAAVDKDHESCRLLLEIKTALAWWSLSCLTNLTARKTALCRVVAPRKRLPSSACVVMRCQAREVTGPERSIRRRRDDPQHHSRLCARVVAAVRAGADKAEAVARIQMEGVAIDMQVKLA